MIKLRTLAIFYDYYEVVSAHIKKCDWDYTECVK